MSNDLLLAGIVAIALRIDDCEQGAAPVGVTLSIGGMLVSGYIANPRQFLLDHPITDHLLEVVEKHFGTEPGGSSSDRKVLPEYIHLSDAHYFLPGTHPIPTGSKGVFWRGRISEVKGFHIGILTSSAEEFSDDGIAEGEPARP